MCLSCKLQDVRATTSQVSNNLLRPDLGWRADVLISNPTAGPVGQPWHPFHRRDALPRGTFKDGADGGDHVEEEGRAWSRGNSKRSNPTQATPAPAMG